MSTVHPLGRATAPPTGRPRLPRYGIGALIGLVALVVAALPGVAQRTELVKVATLAPEGSTWMQVCARI